LQLDRIQNFDLIYSELKKNFPKLFYLLPNGKEAMAPVDLDDLYHSSLQVSGMFNPHEADMTFILRCLFNLNISPDKNYDYYEILTTPICFILCERLFNNMVSIVSIKIPYNKGVLHE